MNWHQIWSLPMALIVAVLTVLIMAPVARHIGLVDKPDLRKHHEGVVPLVGGPAIAVALIVVAIFLSWPVDAIGLALGMALIFAVGIVDDSYPIRARYRFAVQLLAGLIAIMGGSVVTNLEQTFSSVSIELGVLAIPFTMIAITGVINAYNMSDGLDGLCGGSVLIATIWLVVAGLSAAEVPIAQNIMWPVVFPLIGALLGFLILNSRYFGLPRGIVFLGDSGSMMLGFFVAWLAIFVTGTSSVPPVVAVWILAIPLLDMIASMIRRVFNGVTPMTADRGHIHHIVLSKGLTDKGAAAGVHGLNILAGAVGLVGWKLEVPQYLMFWTLVAILAPYAAYSLSYWRTESQQLARATKPGVAVSR